MIFVTVGSWCRGFDRLLSAIHALIEQHVITEPVEAQTGNSSFASPLLMSRPFVSPLEFADRVAQARVVISHAGVGTISHALDARKPLIVVPRKASLGEADNDHQFTTARQFEAEGKLLVAYEVEQLPTKLEEAGTFVPAASVVNEEILEEVRRFVEQVAERKNKSTRRN